MDGHADMYEAVGPAVMEMGCTVDMSMLTNSEQCIAREWYECHTGIAQIALYLGDPASNAQDAVHIRYRDKTRQSETKDSDADRTSEREHVGDLYCLAAVKGMRFPRDSTTESRWWDARKANAAPVVMDCPWSIRELLNEEQGTTENVRVGVVLVFVSPGVSNDDNIEQIAKSHLDSCFSDAQTDSTDVECSESDEEQAQTKSRALYRCGPIENQHQWFIPPSLYKNGVPNSDIGLRSHEPGSSTIRAHGAILGMRSTYFRNLVRGKVSDTMNHVIVLDDISHKALVIVIDAMYGTQPGVHLLKYPELLCEIWRFSNNHELNELDERCCNLVSRGADPSTCVTFLKTALEFELWYLAFVLTQELVRDGVIVGDVKRLTVGEARFAIGFTESADDQCKLAETYIREKNLKKLAGRVVNMIRVKCVSLEQLKSIPTRNMIAQYANRSIVMTMLDRCLTTDIGTKSKLEVLRKTRQCEHCSVWYYCRCLQA